MNSYPQDTDVLMEAYLRTRSQIYEGKSIENIPGYLRGVCFKIIQEYSRKRGRFRDLENRLITNDFYLTVSSIDLSLEGFSDEQIEVLSQALEKLSPTDVEILKLRIIEELSWDQVVERINAKSDGGKRLSNQAARKKGSRALKRLQQNFIEIQECQAVPMEVRES
jgi:DNA-directed RNA polymerase specialized sigma24 family protein